MTSEQRRRVRDLFEAAVDHEPGSVRAWIEREAGDDPVVRGEVLSLVEHHSRAGAFLIQPIVEHAGELLADDDPLATGARGAVGSSFNFAAPLYLRLMALASLFNDQLFASEELLESRILANRIPDWIDL